MMVCLRIQKLRLTTPEDASNRNELKSNINGARCVVEIGFMMRFSLILLGCAGARQHILPDCLLSFVIQKCHLHSVCNTQNMALFQRIRTGKWSTGKKGVDIGKFLWREQALLLWKKDIFTSNQQMNNFESIILMMFSVASSVAAIEYKIQVFNLESSAKANFLLGN